MSDCTHRLLNVSAAVLIGGLVNVNMRGEE
jgi:hypothetical protein